MRDRSSLVFNDEGLNRLRARVDDLGSRAKGVMDLAGKTLARRLPVRASELVSDRILNVPRRTARGFLSAKASGENVILYGVEKRIPLHQFTGTRYGGRKTPGAVVKKWRDAPAEVYSAERARQYGTTGGAFAIKGRGVKGGIYQRVKGRYYPGTNREVITRRLGPSFARAITDRKHGDIYPELIQVGRDVLRAEIQRLLARK
jgi:hypothetical protein